MEYRAEGVTLLNHKTIVDEFYRGNFYDRNIRNATLKEELFHIHAPYDAKKVDDSGTKKPKQMRLIREFDETTQKVQQNYALFQSNKDDRCSSEQSDNKRALEFVENFNARITYDVDKCFNGGNDSDYVVITELNAGERFLIPPRSQFFNRNIEQFAEVIDRDAKFDLIVLDPPWWNKYIRRVKSANAKISYRMLYNERIRQIPLEDHLHENTLVVVWCTNSATHVDAILKEFFPKWGLQHTGSWYWVKITSSGQPVCSFGEPNQKQPYERLFLGQPAGSKWSVPSERFLYSIPSAIHSHKPPLYGLFRKLLPENPKCLELFARTLQPHFTSIGLEVLKLQSTRLFELAMGQ